MRRSGARSCRAAAKCKPPPCFPRGISIRRCGQPVPQAEAGAPQAAARGAVRGCRSSAPALPSSGCWPLPARRAMRYEHAVLRPASGCGRKVAWNRRIVTDGKDLQDPRVQPRPIPPLTVLTSCCAQPRLGVTSLLHALCFGSSPIRRLQAS